jgi:hypothetical protein
VNALAYTQGQDIEVGPGKERHIPHEGWHAVQQMQGRVEPTMQTQGLSINDEVSLEREADVMGAKASQSPLFGRAPDCTPLKVRLTAFPPARIKEQSESTSVQNKQNEKVLNHRTSADQTVPVLIN